MSFDTLLPLLAVIALATYFQTVTGFGLGMIVMGATSGLGLGSVHAAGQVEMGNGRSICRYSGLNDEPDDPEEGGRQVDRADLLALLIVDGYDGHCVGSWVRRRAASAAPPRAGDPDRCQGRCSIARRPGDCAEQPSTEGGGW